MIELLLNRFLRWVQRKLLLRWALRRGKVAFIFTRYDGQTAEVDCCACSTCKNYFWAQHVILEPPKFCPFCGSEFGSVIPIENEDIQDIQSL